jgi:hypothetical protein
MDPPTHPFEETSFMNGILPILSKNQNIFWKIKNLNTCYYYDKFGINMYFLKRFDAQKYQLFEYYI